MADKVNESSASALPCASLEPEKRKMPSLVLITGMSGAGRTEAMHVFEDLGYFCVDNLPAPLIGELVDIHGLPGQKSGSAKIAVVCDARNHDYFKDLTAELNRLDENDVDYRILYLTAAEEKLIARYKSSRRRHPLCDDGSSIAQGIKNEEALLHDLLVRADYVIDTTDMLPQQLKANLRSIFADEEVRHVMNVTVYSFGFKHGAPNDADVVMDVRFLPNPYYVPELKNLTGLDEPVRRFVREQPETEIFKRRWLSLLDCIMPGYVAEGKGQLAIAIGCTGGQHRSVVLAEVTADYLKALGYRVSIAHRDLTHKETVVEEG